MSDREKERLTEAYIDRYNLAIKRFKLEKKDALQYGAIEKRIWSVYGSSSQTLAKLFLGQVSLRSQLGLADRFIEAAYRAKDYLPYMESIFDEYGVPPVVTRMAFVESMFNIKAKSKAGAAGIWQFMPQTGKRYLRINELVDERLSPFKATKAAAQFLKNSYGKLESWPLTITSYNYGLNGILKAVNRLNTRSLNSIIELYEAPNFQYASKNFYAEFVAAVNVYNTLVLLKKIPRPEDASNVKAFALKKRLSVDELVLSSGVDIEVFKKYNPCIRDKTFSSYKHVKLPFPYEVFLPSKLASFVENRDEAHLMSR
ncbi:MAG: lytic transglycosylase domain-containing protein [Deltaproteobacteria bacterium]|nr:lytic transglycosylase domain-containing protein [Deltaproteobacteria bacterium]